MVTINMNYSERTLEMNGYQCKGFEARTASGSVYEIDKRNGEFVVTQCGKLPYVGCIVEEVLVCYNHTTYIDYPDDAHKFLPNQGLSLVFKLKNINQLMVTSAVAVLAPHLTED